MYTVNEAIITVRIEETAMETTLEKPVLAAAEDPYVLSVRVSAAMLADVRRAAEREFTNVSTIIRKALAQYVEERS
jgi:Ribbon-helix-helix protein, copG family